MGRHRRAYEGEVFSVRIDVPMTPTDRSARLGELFDEVPPYEKSHFTHPPMRALLNAASAIGNNTMQMRGIAHMAGQDDSVEVLNEVEGQMCGALGRALPP